MLAAQIFKPKNPTLVEAFQFLGWQNAEEFHKWFPNAFFVPRGYEHHLRWESETDRSRGDVLDDAPPYLVLPSGSKRGVRVDVGQWVIKREDRVDVVNNQDFVAKYKAVTEEGDKVG